MYKLLIVEDEIWEREGLVDFIDWRQLNIQIVGTASNGIQGLKWQSYISLISLLQILECLFWMA